MAVTTTWLLVPGFTEMAPYCVSTEMLAFGPTLKRSSLRDSAIATDARQVANARVTTAACCSLSILKAPSAGSAGLSLVLLNTLQCHLIKHRLLLIDFQ